MKKTMTRILSLILAVITVFGLMTAPASAASGVSASDSTSTVKVDTSSGKFYIVTTANAKLKTKASAFSSTYATLSKGSLIQTNGSSGDYYKVKMGGTNYFILKSDVKKAGDSFDASIDYTVNNSKSAVRTGPAAKSDIAYKLAKGTAFLLCGTLRRADNSNLWLVVYDTSSRNLVYLYSENSAQVCTQVKLTVSASTNTVNTRGTLQLKASYSPSALTNSITWTSSNPAVATVSKGVVTGITAGTATITATVDGLNGTVAASVDITVSPKVSLNVPVLRQTDSRWKNKYIANSRATIGKYGCTLTSLAMVYSYDTGKTVTPDAMDDLLKFTSGGAVYWDSVSAIGYNRRSYSLAAIYQQLKQGNPVIIGGKNSKNTHWVVITGYTGTSATNFKASNFTINDPGNAKRTTLQDYLNSYPTVTTLVY